MIMCSFYAITSMGAVPLEYYSSANGKKKAELKAALHSTIQVKKVLAYGSGAGKTWSGFYQTDRMADGEVRDRYSNDHRYFASGASAASASAVGGMNIEHSFPKSWWGGTENNAYKDLFNLMPCEQKINSSKSNYAMGKVTTVKTDNGCTKVGTGTTKSGTTKSLWEPADNWKGDFARGYMYMATTYSNFSWTGEGLTMLQQDAWPTLQPWAYQLLLEWCRQDPVDEIEVARNEAVYAIQGNRNPYVDFPNLMEYVWGDSTSIAFNLLTTVKASDIISPDVPITPVDPDVPGGGDDEFQPEYDLDGSLLNIDALLAECTGTSSSSGKSVTYKMENVLVTYANGKNVFITDGRRGFLIYGTNSLGLKSGDRISGTLSGVDYKYNGLPELGVSSMSGVTLVKRGDKVEWPLVTVEDVLADNGAALMSMPVTLAPMRMSATGFSNKALKARDASGDEIKLFDNWLQYTAATYSTLTDYEVQAIPVKYYSEVEVYVVSIDKYSGTVGVDDVFAEYHHESENWYDMSGRRITRQGTLVKPGHVLIR